MLRNLLSVVVGLLSLSFAACSSTKEVMLKVRCQDADDPHEPVTGQLFVNGEAPRQLQREPVPVKLDFSKYRRVFLTVVAPFYGQGFDILDYDEALDMKGGKTFYLARVSR